MTIKSISLKCEYLRKIDSYFSHIFGSCLVDFNADSPCNSIRLLISDLEKLIKDEYTGFVAPLFFWSGIIISIVALVLEIIAEHKKKVKKNPD
ncbi:MAG: hypothetical protein A2Y62_02390 [Candidatus Fischerbacteria bacterium RBG_13_37_8]|uniref:Uncharacterized protein n=1 Tax=Candidatus Fischerbacteria bacterium RBG_13_37_8 TaxID=1817863 RepID=A0A1F5VY44_9BACT|nr:MAG: hypothetical protein A2Y62_02390 [Candidatus Fischerbacteria bacterium RBG_13_37_8]